MTSRTNPPASACEGKVPFASKSQATASAKIVSRRKTCPACAYKCAHCGAWHVGTTLHKSPPSKRMDQE